MTVYGKIFDRVFTGSMYGSGPVVFAVWAYVIANTEPPGVIELNPRLLAACIGTSTEDIKAALDYLTSPDDDSQNTAEQGRRLVQISGLMYQVVSFDKYRKLQSAEDRREYHRAYWHTRKLNDKSTKLNGHSTTLNNTQRDSSNSTEAEAEKENKPLARVRARGGGLFDRFWEAYPRKASKGRAEKAFAKINPDEQLVGRMCAAIERAKTSEQWRKDGGQFIKHPATWLNDRGWEDELPTSGADDELAWLRRVE